MYMCICVYRKKLFKVHKLLATQLINYSQIT